MGQATLIGDDRRANVCDQVPGDHAARSPRSRQESASRRADPGLLDHASPGPDAQSALTRSCPGYVRTDIPPGHGFFGAGCGRKRLATFATTPPVRGGRIPQLVAAGDRHPLSAGEPGAAYCRGSALATAEPPLPAAVGLPSVVGYGGRLPSSARGGRPHEVFTGRR
jgi:hypothetical protein